MVLYGKDSISAPNEHVFNNISAIWHILPWAISSYISYYTIILLLRR